MTPIEAENDDLRRQNRWLLTIILRLRNFLNALWLDCKTEGIAESTLEKYRSLGTAVNAVLKRTGTNP